MPFKASWYLGFIKLRYARNLKLNSSKFSLLPSYDEGAANWKGPDELKAGEITPPPRDFDEVPASAAFGAIVLKDVQQGNDEDQDKDEGYHLSDHLCHVAILLKVLKPKVVLKLKNLLVGLEAEPAGIDQLRYHETMRG